MKVRYRESARDDVLRQFRYYLIDQNLPEIAERFKDAIRHTVGALRKHPLIGARYQSANHRLRDLRSWPVAGFEAIRIYYLVDARAIQVVRVLHGKRDVKLILEENLSDRGTK